jgi:hypothetical protein
MHIEEPARIDTGVGGSVPHASQRRPTASSSPADVCAAWLSPAANSIHRHTDTHTHTQTQTQTQTQTETERQRDRETDRDTDERERQTGNLSI